MPGQPASKERLELELAELDFPYRRFPKLEVAALHFLGRSAKLEVAASHFLVRRSPTLEVAALHFPVRRSPKLEVAELHFPVRRSPIFEVAALEFFEFGAAWDLNPESPASEADALSIRPWGLVAQLWLQIQCSQLDWENQPFDRQDNRLQPL
eukprot:5339156-Amphidinium_carterae.1